MSKEPIQSSSASRGRRYRQRQRDGEVVVRVPVSRDAIAGLVRYGLIDTDNVTRGGISFALEIFLDAVSKDAIDFNEAWIKSFADG